jgi:hypothetical protein
MMRQPHVDARRAVDAGDVIIAVRAVDVDGKGTARRVGLRILELGRRCARNQIHQVLIVAVLIQRQIDDVCRLEIDADVGFVGLEHCRVSRYGDRFAQRSNFQLAVNSDDAARCDRDARLDEFFEALQRHVHRVGAAGDVADVISSG